MSRVAYQAGVRAMQRIIDHQASKCDPTVKHRDDSCLRGSSSSQARKLSGATESTGYRDDRKGDDDKSKHAEESLRKVMYLSCWGPN